MQNSIDDGINDAIAKKSENILNGLELANKDDLDDASIDDSILLRHLPEGAKPIKELPVDPVSDILYDQRNEPRCVLCQSSYRTLAEHVYIYNNEKAHAVMAFFLEYFNARVSWEGVKTHMTKHCDFSKLARSGLKMYGAQNENIAVWEYRENELAMRMLLNAIDDLQGLRLEKRVDLKLKQVDLIRKLAEDLINIKEKRDQAQSKSVDWMQHMSNMWTKVTDPTAKSIILAEIAEIKKILDG